MGQRVELEEAGSRITQTQEKGKCTTGNLVHLVAGQVSIYDRLGDCYHLCLSTIPSFSFLQFGYPNTLMLLSSMSFLSKLRWFVNVLSKPFESAQLTKFKIDPVIILNL